jgi:Uma2 family endonuclease
MTISMGNSTTDIGYPDTDGLPMTESDPTRDYLTYAVEALNIYFQNDSNVYVSGNLFIYYEEGNPKAVVSPDVFVVFGVTKKKRRSYRAWEENNKIPDFVLEITSKSTVSEDQGVKKGLYAFLGVQEYFQYDPTGDYLIPQLKGFRLIEGNYLLIPTTSLVNGDAALFSQVLGLELRLSSGEMRFYDPVTGDKLLSHQESEEARRGEKEKVQKLAAKLRELGIDPDDLEKS